MVLRLIDEGFGKRAWHGTNLKGSLRGLTAKEASRRPGRGRHNIWEIAVHAAYWKYAVRRRLLGEKRGSFPLKGSNWFTRPAPGADWKKDLRLLDGMHITMRRAVASLRDSGTVIADINLTEDLEDALGDPQGSGALWDSLTQNRWAVYGFISDSATISNLLRDNKVECTSCHDPHFKNSSWDEVDGSEGASTWDTGDLTCGSLEKCGDGNFLSHYLKFSLFHKASEAAIFIGWVSTIC